jgi:hypothetical protein
MIDATAAPSKRQTANSVMHLLDINPGWHIRVGSNWRYRRALPVEEFQLFNADGQFQQVLPRALPDRLSMLGRNCTGQKLRERTDERLRRRHD